MVPEITSLGGGFWEGRPGGGVPGEGGGVGTSEQFGYAAPKAEAVAAWSGQTVKSPQALRVVLLVLVYNWAPLAPIGSLGWYLGQLTVGQRPLWGGGG